MYSERLERLIKGALADGVLEDREIAVLRRVAVEEGVDPDELQMDVEARLVEMNAGKPRPEKQKVGTVRKCPMCGAVLTGLEVKCPDCGHTFTGVEAVNSAKKFAEGLQKIVKSSSDSPMGQFSDFLGFKRKEVNTYIRNFPVPNTAEDLFEFMISMYAGRSDLEFGSAYKAKFNECYQKASLLFPDDPKFVKFQEQLKSNWWNRKTIITKALIIGAVAYVLIMVFSIIMYKLG